MTKTDDNNQYKAELKGIEEVRQYAEQHSDEELTLEEIKLMSKFGRVKSVKPFRVEYDFTILDRPLTNGERKKFAVLMEKLSKKLHYKLEPTPELIQPKPDSYELDTPKGFIDFFGQFLVQGETTARNALAYSEDNAPTMPNTSFYDLFFRALTSPQYISHGHISNSNEKIEVITNDNDITIRRETKSGESHTIKISNFNYNKRNKTTVLIFSYFFQSLAQTPGATSVYLSYKELVDIGMYDTVDGARRGVNTFYDYFHGNDKKHIAGVSVSGKFKARDRKFIPQKERDLITGRDIEEGGQTIYLNKDLNLMMLFTAFTSNMPLWAYRLKNLDAFLLVRYIFYTARMKGNNFSMPEKEDQNDQHPYKRFTLTMDSIRDALGLPAPEDVAGRKYKEKIRDPIEKAIEDIEMEILRINDASQSVLVTLTPQGTDNAVNIADYLRCQLEVGIADELATAFIEATSKHKKHVDDFKKRVEKEKAKNVAKNQKTDAT